MGGKSKEQQDNRLPGPGAYEPKDNLVKETIKTQVFSKTSRQDIVTKDERLKPGPGNYDNLKEFGKDAKAA